MENNMVTMAADPAVAHPMTSYEDVIRTCSLSPKTCNNTFREILCRN